MKIYEVDADFEKYDACKVDYKACAKEHKFGENELLIDFDGTSKIEGWWPRIMRRYNDLALQGDYINKLCGDVMILEKKAIEKLKHLMKNMEILPLECDFGDYWAINVMDVLDCIDYEHAKYDLLPTPHESGRQRIMSFDKYAFIKEKIAGYNIFKIFDEPKSSIFVNDIFVGEVERQGITGFDFKPVWEG